MNRSFGFFLSIIHLGFFYQSFIWLFISIVPCRPFLSIFSCHTFLYQSFIWAFLSIVACAFFYTNRSMCVFLYQSFMCTFLCQSFHVRFFSYQSFHVRFFCINRSMSYFRIFFTNGIIPNIQNM